MQTQTILPHDLASWFLVGHDDESVSQEKTPIIPPFRIGRREGFELSLANQKVSGLHAEILEEDGQLWLYDLNSTNGTFLNGQRIRERMRLRENDTILFGSCAFTAVFESVGAERHPMATLESAPSEAKPETAEEKFHRLLDSGATPFFQPIYDISGATRRRIGFEVLGRSRMFGLRTPDQMFAAALKFEKEATLSRMLRQRGVEAADADLPSDLMLFVNTHPSELESGDLEESLREIRKRFPARQIVLELPESTLNSPDSFVEVRGVLLDLGIRLAIHDFGAGQIRLSELSEMAPDIVKFDCALIQGIDKASSKRQRLVAAMAKMVRELGITAMAEYIELPGEHETLKQMGVQYGQGFHYGRPIDIKDVSCEKDAGQKISLSAPPKNFSKNSNHKLLEELKRVDDSDRKVDSDQKTKHRGADWLLAQPGDCYTIQLTMSSVESRTTEFIAKQSLPGDYAVYRKRGRISEWFVVVFGVYQDRDSAKADSENINSAGVSPWIRNLSAVQTEIQSFSVEK